MEVIDNQNEKSTESHYVSTIDIQNMDPCWFSNKTNPVSGNKCRETFQSQSQTSSPLTPSPTNDMEKIKILLGVLGIGVLFFYCRHH
jgi:hypothetical protein